MKSLILSCALALSCLASSAQAADPTYTIGSSPTGSPFTFLDIKTNKMDGVMVDLIEAIGKDAGFIPKIEPIAFSALIPALTSKKIDLISTSMMITEERRKVVDFTLPLFPYAEGLIVPVEDRKAYKTLDDMQGMVVGVQEGTRYFDVLKAQGKFAEVKAYRSLADIIRDVELGRIKAGFGDQPIFKYRLSQDKNAKVHLVPTYQPLVKGDIALVVRKGDEAMRERLNRSIERLKASGTIESLLKKWGL